VFDFRLHRIQQRSFLIENGDVEVIVVIKNDNFAKVVDSHSDRIVRKSFTTDLAQKFSAIVENFNAVCAIVTNENLVLVVRTNSVRKFQVARARKLLLYVSIRVENDDSHDLALDNDNSSLTIDTDTTGMLKNVGTEFAQKLAILIVDLNLMSRTTLSYDKVSGSSIDTYTKNK
jgi:hypothetical protein